MVDQGKQDENNEELNLEQQLDKANNTPKMTVISAKVYQKDKAEFIKNADEYGRTTAGQIAYLMRKFNRGELLSPEQYETDIQEIEELKEKWESEANLHKQAVKDLEELKKKNKELEKKLTDAKKSTDGVKEELEKQVQDLNEEAGQWAEKTGDLEKQVKDKDEEIKNLKKKLKQTEQKRDEYRQKFDHKANEVKELVERLNKANTWIEGHSGDFFGHEYPGEF